MIIPYTDAYEAFVKSCWTRGLLDTQRWPKNRRLAQAAVRALVDRLVGECNIAVMVGEDPTQALGCVAWNAGVLHWLYVKRPMRGMGRGSQLLEYAGRPSSSSVTTDKWPRGDISYEIPG